MGIAHDIMKKVGRALGGVHAGTEKLAASKLGEERNAELVVTSPAFHVGDRLPRSATADGEGVPPPIAWSRVPPQAKSVVVVCEDPDAPFPEPFVHWLVWGLPGEDGVLDGGRIGSVRQGQNSKGGRGFTGAAPPPGHGTHHYHFQVFALDGDVALDEGAGRGALFDRMKGHVLAWGDLVGTYERS